MSFQPATPDYDAMVRGSFAKQGMMRHLGADIADVRPGFVEIRLPHRDEVLQQHGLFHGGATSSILDSAGGYAALSLFTPGDGILTVEFKVNLTAPAMGDELVARGEIVKLGKTLSVTRGEALVVRDGVETTCAVMQQTLMRIVGRADVSG